MGAIPPSYRTSLSREEFLVRCETLNLQPIVRNAAGGPIFAVLSEFSERREWSRPGTTLVEPTYFLTLLDGYADERGRPLLRLVGDTRDPRRVALAWTEAGKEERASWRAWGGATFRERTARLKALRSGHSKAPRRERKGGGGAAGYA